MEDMFYSLLGGFGQDTSSLPPAPGMVDPTRPSNPEGDALLDPMAEISKSYKRLRRRYTVTHHAQQFDCSSEPEMRELTSLRAKALEGRTIIRQEERQFAVATGSFVLYIEWVELQPRNKAEQKLVVEDEVEDELPPPPGGKRPGTTQRAGWSPIKPEVPEEPEAWKPPAEDPFAEFFPEEGEGDEG